MFWQGRHGSEDKIVHTGPVVYTQDTWSRVSVWGCVPPPTQGSVHVCQGEPHLGVNLAVSGCFLNVPRTLLTGMVGPKEKKKKKSLSRVCR